MDKDTNLMMNISTGLLAVMLLLNGALLAQINVAPNSPYAEDFEGSNGGWTAGSGEWEWGVPSTPNWNFTTSGTKMWITDRNNNYANGLSHILESPVFDLSAFGLDPILSIQAIYRLSPNDVVIVSVDRGDGLGYQLLGTNEAGWYNSGNAGGLGHPGWINFSVKNGSEGYVYRRLATRLDACAGRSAVQLRFELIANASTSHRGFGFDDVSIAQAQQITDTSSFVEDFESDDGGFSVHRAGNWELGTPSQSGLSSAYSGTQAWMTDLDADYEGAGRLLSPWLGCAATTIDPVLSFWTKHRSEPGVDGLRVRVDDGNGFVDAPIAGTSMVSALGADGLSGNSGGWRRVVLTLPGLAGLSHGRFELQFSADGSNHDEGFAIDDLRVDVFRCHGSEASGADLTLEMMGDGDDFEGSRWQKLTLAPKSTDIELRLSSPNQEWVYRSFLLAVEIRGNAAPFSQPFPGICVSANTNHTFLISGTGPSFAPSILPSAGYSLQVTIPPIAQATTRRFIFQGLVLDTSAPNGIFVSTNPRTLTLIDF